ncbi:MAG: putative lipoprotein YmbA [Janthinobacterium sp.]|jgi:uncharacterized lipoprotein YmbA
MTHAWNTIYPNAGQAQPGRTAAWPVAAWRRATLLPAALLSVLLLASGCAIKPTSYYTLTTAPLAIAPAVAVTGATASAADAIFIELAPVAVPERLARPQMVLTRPGGQSAKVELLEQHRWIASFELELRDALASGIAVRAGAIDVTRGGAPSLLPVWRIAVQLRQFEAIEAERVDAAFSWTARRSDADQDSACRWAGSVQVGSGIDALAQGAQQLTDQTAQAIARHLAALSLDPAAACGQ